MEARKLATQDRAVTPVIGVILVVAITVVLASIVGVYALDLGSGVSEGNPPGMSFDFDYDSAGSDSLRVTFKAGEKVDAGRLELVVSEAQTDSNNGRYSFIGPSPGLDADSGTFEAEESVTLDEDVTGSSLDLSEAKVRVVWTSQNTNPDATRSSTVAVWTGPEA